MTHPLSLRKKILGPVAKKKAFALRTTVTAVFFCFVSYSKTDEFRHHFGELSHSLTKADQKVSNTPQTPTHLMYIAATQHLVSITCFLVTPSHHSSPICNSCTLLCCNCQHLSHSELHQNCGLIHIPSPLKRKMRVAPDPQFY